MKTVWIVNHYAQTPGGPGGTRHYELAQALSHYGWRACILAASTELNTGRQRLSSGECFRLDDVDGIPFLWIYSPVYRGSGIGRVINMISFAFRILDPFALRVLDKPDLIVGSSVHPFAVWSSCLLAKWYRVPFVFEVRDLWPQTLIDFGLIKYHSISAILLRRLEGYLYRKASVVITLLPHAYKYIERFGIKRDRIHWIPNGVNTAIPLLSAPRNLTSSKEFCLMYFGSFGQANNLETLLMAMHVLQRRNTTTLRLRMIGDGPMKASLISLASQLNLSSVVFEDPVSKRDIPLLASQADCFVATMKHSPLYQYGISLNKIFDYMLAGKPVIFATSAANNPISESGAGFSVAPEDPVALADAVELMIKAHPAERNTMGASGREYVKKQYDSRMLAATFADVLDIALDLYPAH